MFFWVYPGFPELFAEILRPAILPSGGYGWLFFYHFKKFIIVAPQALSVGSGPSRRSVVKG